MLEKLKNFSQNPFFTALFSRLRTNKSLFVGILAASLIAGAMEGFSFSCLLFGLSSFGESHSQSFIFFSFLKKFQPQEIFFLFFIFAIVFQVLRSGFSYLAQMGVTHLGVMIQTLLQESIFSQIFRLSYRSVNNYKLGDLAEYAKAPSHFTMPVMDAFCRLLVSSVMILAYVIFMLILSPTVTLFNLLLISLAAFFQRYLMRKIAVASEVHMKASVEQGKTLVQNLYGIKHLHLFNRQLEVLAELKSDLDKATKTNKKLNFWFHLGGPFNEVLGIFLVGACLLMGFFFFQSSTLSLISFLLTYLTVIYRLSTRLQIAAEAIRYIGYYKGELSRLEDILSPNDKEYAVEKGEVLGEFKEAITFRDVSLTYSSREEATLKKLSFQIPKGKITAIVGHSGAGKTSVLELLARLYEPTEGTIEIDQHCLSRLQPRDWRKQLGIVSQDCLIFNGTIAENIRFGCSSDLENIRTAAQLAGAESFIQALPQKYETLVGEKGYLLSGGEKQRIALARALLRNPSILILDEATSNLDSYAEAIILEALEKFREDKTLIVVAHRLSTIAQADQILVLSKGELVEQGTHEELLKCQGEYYAFWQLQNNF